MHIDLTFEAEALVDGGELRIQIKKDKRHGGNNDRVIQVIDPKIKYVTERGARNLFERVRGLHVWWPDTRTEGLEEKIRPIILQWLDTV